VAWFSFIKADRRVSCYYFYLWDEEFGPAFIKICSYFPYPAKIWINGHEWAKRQAVHAGIRFTELSNGFAATTDPTAVQRICDQLGPATIEAFTQRWLSVLPLPLTEHDRAAAYWWQLSMRQIEVDGLAFAILYTKLHNRVLRPLMATTAPQAPQPLRAALHTIDQHIHAQLAQARLPTAAA